MIVLVCANQKGGAGKTTTSTNITAALAAMGARVLLIDADPQGQAGHTFGVEIETIPGERTVGMMVVRELMSGNVPAQDFLAAAYDCSHVLKDFDDVGTIHVIGSTQVSASDANFMLKQKTSQPGAVMALRYLLERVAGSYDYVVVDSPPSVDALATLCWCSGDGIIATAIPESSCLDGTVAMVGVSDKVFALSSGARRPLFLGTVITRNLPPSQLNPASTSADTDAILTINSIIHAGGMVFERDIRRSTHIQAQKTAMMPAAISQYSRPPGKQYGELVAEMFARMESPGADWPTMPVIDMSVLTGVADGDD